ncbi:Mediator of RNA polymerase II transcription subunit 20 [Lonchura striata]|uniref:Mediator of RNA polymerase II transcription subunit 20 n=1 Tax=Lonchura striata TaxID=40157 RepID=A0A218UDA7_9PASE|nr:Mediator of RNA polymerase II transcription subunit 20 [Lonchura striata domestica]
MGVTCVSQVPVAEGKSVQQTVELLARRLEALGADKQGTFGVDCETYHTAAALGTQGQTGKLMYVMHNSEYPLSCFALFENGPCLVADTNFDTLMVKLKGFFQNAKANKIESRGTRYQYCDFLVKLGTVTMGPSARGISVEVEYCPCVIANDCWNLLMEFMQSFMGSHTPGVPPVFSSKHDSTYSPGDTMVQYMELFNKIRKQQQVPVAGISVSQVPVAEGKSVQQTVELLARRLEALGADKQGTFGVDCETYHTAAALGTQGQTGKLMYVMHNSEYPLSCFALFENGPCLVADTNFDTLMVKLKGFFQNAKANKIESRGTRYQYCDFLVKLGTVTMGPSARGISVEVEYCPCVIANDCWNLLMEFMQSFMGSHTPGVPPVFSSKHDSTYSPGDTMVQYMELFNKIRKQQQVPVAGIR